MNKFGHYLKWLDVQKTLKEKDFEVFTPLDFSQVFGTNLENTRHILSRHTKEGHLTRLKRGLYALSSERPDPFLLANRLYLPSYISLETALSFHGLIPETVYTITSVTTKPTREFTACGISFTYSTIKKEAFTGYGPNDIQGKVIYIATQEKAVADFLYFVSLGKKSLNDRLRIKKIDKKEVFSYAKLFGRPEIVNLLDKIPKEEKLL